MTYKNLPQMMQEIIAERDALLETTYRLRENCLEAMSILKDDPDAANAATEAWDILNGGACEACAAA